MGDSASSLPFCYPDPTQPGAGCMAPRAQGGRPSTLCPQQTEAPLLTRKPPELRSYFCAPLGLVEICRKLLQCPLSSRLSGGWANTGWLKAGRGLAVVASPSPGGLLRLCPTRGQQKARAGAGGGGFLGHQEKSSFHLPKLGAKGLSGKAGTGETQEDSCEWWTGCGLPQKAIRAAGGLLTLLPSRAVRGPRAVAGALLTCLPPHLSEGQGSPQVPL